ncbi:MAG: NUDIX domain-containing protein [Myxococcota bacterium]
MDSQTNSTTGAPDHGPRIVVAAGLVWLGHQRVLVPRKPPDAAFGARALELPGGKLERGEAPAPALRRELVEEWGAGARRLVVGPVAEVLHHVYPPPGPEVVLVVYHVDGRALPPGPVESLGLTPEPGLTLCAFDLPALPVAEFLAADRRWIGALRDGRVRPPAWDRRLGED